MALLNEVNFIGRLVRDAEAKSTKSGASMVSFTVAVDETKKDSSGQYKKETSFFNLTWFGTTAQKVKPMLTKGTLVLVQGSLRQNNWEKDGVKHFEIGVNIKNVRLLGRPSASTAGGGNSAEKSQSNFQPSDEEFPEENEIEMYDGEGMYF